MNPIIRFWIKSKHLNGLLESVSIMKLRLILPELVLLLPLTLTLSKFQGPKILLLQTRNRNSIMMISRRWLEMSKVRFYFLKDLKSVQSFKVWMLNNLRKLALIRVSCLSSLKRRNPRTKKTLQLSPWNRKKNWRRILSYHMLWHARLRLWKSKKHTKLRFLNGHLLIQLQ
jgi:hypothetical protein